MQAIIWNTGRWYAAEGQQIAATIIERTNDEGIGTVRFYDVSRGIDGSVRMPDIDIACGPESIARAVMRAYDYGTDETGTAYWIGRQDCDRTAVLAKLRNAALTVGGAGDRPVSPRVVEA